MFHGGAATIMFECLLGATSITLAQAHSDPRPQRIAAAKIPEKFIPVCCNRMPVTGNGACSKSVALLIGVIESDPRNCYSLPPGCGVDYEYS